MQKLLFNQFKISTFQNKAIDMNGPFLCLSQQTKMNTKKCRLTLYDISYKITAILFTFLLANSLHSQALEHKTEWVKISTISAISLTSTLGFRLIPASQCYWCKVNIFDEAISRRLKWDNIESARVSSDLVAFLLIPFLSITSTVAASSDNSEVFLDLATIFSSLTTTVAVTELTKITARRARPDTLWGLRAPDNESNRSFFSGHTSFAFSLATSTSLILHRRGAWWAPYFTAVSSMAALYVGYARIAALRHWTSDVLVGLSAGIAMGAIVPLFIRENDEKDSWHISIYPAGTEVQISMMF